MISFLAINTFGLQNENKGLGILSKKNNFFIDETHNKDLINFLPIKSDNLKCLVFGHLIIEQVNSVPG